MSTSARNHRIQVLAAALGVGIGVMTGQGIAHADDTGSSSDTSSSSTASSSDSESSAAVQNSTRLSNADTSGGSDSATDSDSASNSHVGGNGLSSDSDANASDTRSSGNGLSSATQTTDTHTGGNGLSTATETRSVSAAEAPGDDSTSNGLPDAGTFDYDLPATTELDIAELPAAAPIVPIIADIEASVVDIEPPVVDVEPVTLPSFTRAVDAVTENYGTATRTASENYAAASETASSAADLLPRTVAGADSHVTIPGVRLPAVSLPGLELPRVEIPELTLPRLASPSSSLPAVTMPSAAFLTISALPRTLPEQTTDLPAASSALAALLVVPGLPVGPLPGPPVPPLAWALATWNRRATDGLPVGQQPAVTDFDPFAGQPLYPAAAVNPTPTPTSTASVPAAFSGFPTITSLLFNQTPGAQIHVEQHPETGTVTGSVTAVDPDTENHTYTVTRQPDNGTVTIDENSGAWTYTPDADTAANGGSVSFDVTVIDSTDPHLHLDYFLAHPFEPGALFGGHTTTVAVNFDIAESEPNTPPLATDDTLAVKQGTTLNANILTNDTDTDIETVSIDTITQPTHGTLEHDPAGNIVYTPTDNYTGTDTFTYTITDGTDTSNTATVTISVTPNTPPVATDDTLTVKQGDTLNAYILGNDTDADIETLTVESVTQPTHGTLEHDPAGNIVYTPHPDYTGTDTFTYTITDGTDTDTATVTITVTPNTPPGNQAPSAVVITDDTAYPDGIVTGTFTATDPTGDGDDDASLTYTVTNPPERGELRITDPESGAFSYTVDDAYAAGANAASVSDEFSITVTDSLGASTTTTLTIVSPTSDATTVTRDGETSSVTKTPDGLHTVVTTAVMTPYGKKTLVSVIDPSTGQATEPVELSGDVVDVTITADSRYALVAHSTAVGTHVTEVRVIDIATGEPTNSHSYTQVGDFVSLTPTADGQHAYVVTYDAATDASRVSLIETTTGTDVAILDNGVRRSNIYQEGSNPTIALTPDGTHAYFTTQDPSRHAKVWVISTDTGVASQVDVAPYSGYNAVLAMAPAGDRVYVSTDYKLLVIDTSTNEVIATTVAAQPFFPVEITVAADGQHVYVVGETTDSDGYTTIVTTTDADGVAVLQTVRRGEFVDLTVTPDGEHAILVTHTATGVEIVTLIDVDTPGNGISIPTDGSKTTVTSTADSSHAFVTTTSAGQTTVYVVDTATGSSTAFPVPGDYSDIAFTADGERAYVLTHDAESNVTRITVIDIASGTPTVTAFGSGAGENATITLTEDGSHAFITTYYENKTYVTLVDTSNGAATTPVPVDGDIVDLTVTTVDGVEYLVVTTTDGTATTVTLVRDPAETMPSGGGTLLV